MYCDHCKSVHNYFGRCKYAHHEMSAVAVMSREIDEKNARRVQQAQDQARRAREEEAAQQEAIQAQRALEEQQRQEAVRNAQFALIDAKLAAGHPLTAEEKGLYDERAAQQKLAEAASGVLGTVGLIVAGAVVIGAIVGSEKSPPPTPSITTSFYTASNNPYLYYDSNRVQGIIAAGSCVMIKSNARRQDNFIEVELTANGKSYSGFAARNHLTAITSSMSVANCTATLRPDNRPPPPPPPPQWPEPKAFRVAQDAGFYATADATAPNSILHLRANSCITVSGPAVNGRYPMFAAPHNLPPESGQRGFISAQIVEELGLARNFRGCTARFESVPSRQAAPTNTLTVRFMTLNQDMRLLREPKTPSADNGTFQRGVCVRVNANVPQQNGYMSVTAVYHPVRTTGPGGQETFYDPMHYSGWVPVNQVTNAPEGTTLDSCRTRRMKEPPSFFVR